jgi:hypothetical protein
LVGRARGWSARRAGRRCTCPCSVQKPPRTCRKTLIAMNSARHRLLVLHQQMTGQKQQKQSQLLVAAASNSRPASDLTPGLAAAPAAGRYLLLAAGCSRSTAWQPGREAGGHLSGSNDLYRASKAGPSRRYPACCTAALASSLSRVPLPAQQAQRAQQAQQAQRASVLL